jgi:hypothetical protein
MNICVVQGVVVGEPRIVVLPSGQWAVSFDVGSTGEESSAPVPVEWTGPEAAIPKVVSDAPVAVTGSIRRRFFRAGGSIHTRVYVRPDTIVIRSPARQSRTIRKALSAALGSTPS